MYKLMLLYKVDPFHVFSVLAWHLFVLILVFDDIFNSILVNYFVSLKGTQKFAMYKTNIRGQLNVIIHIKRDFSLMIID